MLNLFDVKIGDRVLLKDGREGTVFDNMDDGQYIEVTIDGSLPDREPDLIHSEDLAKILGA